VQEPENSEKDRVLTATKVVTTLAGGGLSAAAAATLGAGSVPVLTTVGSWVGVSILAATPVGWVIGAAVVGAGACYAGLQLIEGAGREEGKHNANAALKAECDRVEQLRSNAAQLTPAKVEEAQRALAEMVRENHLDQDTANALFEEIRKGHTSIEETSAVAGWQLATSPDVPPLALAQTIGEREA